MSALPTRMGRRLGLLAVLAALAIPVGIATPAVAAPPEQPVAKYVALGDSYAAGQGSGVPLDGCLRSATAYPVLLDAEPRTNLLRTAACSGATVGAVSASQLAQVNRGTTLITLTVGANDVGVGDVAAACLPAPASPACAIAIQTAMGVLQSGQVGTALTALLLDAAARSPRAHLVVTDYPLPFAPGAAGAIGDQLNLATGLLDAQIAGAVQAAALAGVDVELASVQLAFLGHGAGSGASWLGENPADPISFLHPTATGQAAYRDVILTALAS
ncbi:GDSL-type esterase/lipase family protein [Agromyces sp. MMS24-K17]|uniref:GDSL-type esterase/lipase family protein n=1 Tax=Agromyces sp. MMS24-K17 TaxID=3372850 RepID=UPI0037540A8B